MRPMPIRNSHHSTLSLIMSHIKAMIKTIGMMIKNIYVSSCYWYRIYNHSGPGKTGNPGGNKKRTALRPPDYRGYLFALYI